MKKYFFISTILLFAFFLLGCEAADVIKASFNTDTATLKSRVKEMIIAENFKIDIDDPFLLRTEWRKTTKEENNIPDYSIEARLEATINSTDSGSEILLKVMKRSSLDSQDPITPTYKDISTIKNDLLYKRWNDKLKSLQEEFKK